MVEGFDGGDKLNGAAVEAMEDAEGDGGDGAYGEEGDEEEVGYCDDERRGDGRGGELLVVRSEAEEGLSGTEG